MSHVAVHDIHVTLTPRSSRETSTTMTPTSIVKYDTPLNLEPIVLEGVILQDRYTPHVPHRHSLCTRQLSVAQSRTHSYMSTAPSSFTVIADRSPTSYSSRTGSRPTATTGIGVCTPRSSTQPALLSSTATTCMQSMFPVETRVPPRNSRIPGPVQLQHMINLSQQETQTPEP